MYMYAHQGILSPVTVECISLCVQKIAPIFPIRYFLIKWQLPVGTQNGSGVEDGVKSTLEQTKPGATVTVGVIVTVEVTVVVKFIVSVEVTVCQIVVEGIIEVMFSEKKYMHVLYN